MTDKIQKITDIVQKASWTTGVLIKENGNIIYEFNIDHEFKAASLIKLGIALYIKEKCPNTLNDVININQNQVVAGAGVINRLSITQWKSRDLCDLMLCLSDNTATNCLLDYYHIDEINDFLRNNFNQVQLGRYLMKAGPENIASPKTIMDIFEKLFTSENEIGRIIINALKHQEIRNKLVAYSNAKYTTFNKTGELADIQHDIARFKKGAQVIDCCVMNSYQVPEDYEKIIKMMQEIGKILTS